MSQQLTKIQLGMISQAAQAALQGQTGATGPQGLQGASGVSGPQGIQGEVGATGPIGATGISVTGATGLQGIQGPVGATGLQGIQGIQGERGEVGPVGPSGPSGAQGIEGPSGAQGAIGSTGATGAQGATGLGDKYQTTSTTSLSVSNGTKTLTVETGLAYTQNQPILISATGNSALMRGVVTSYDKNTGALVADIQQHTGSGTYTAWTVNLEGAVGAVGATGLTGATGLQGPSGVAGIDGQQGATGQTGPSGAQGIQGPSGLQGLQGATGEVGPSGAQGVQGVAGEIGATGATGIQGPVGATGIGSTGATGQAGDRYTTASTDSLSLTIGNKSLTVETGLALSIGQQVILAYDATHLMQGEVTSYTALTGALEINVTTVLAGTGTYASWTVSLSGAVGQVGATGATGPSAPVLGGGVLSPQFVGNGSNTEFGPISGWDGPQNDESGYLVYLDGVFQRPDEVNGGFSITGTSESDSKIVFPSAVADGTKIDVLAIQVTGAKGATGATGPGGGGGGNGRGQAWDSTVTYATGDLVTQNNIGWVSIINDNLNVDPATQSGSPSWERVKSNAVQLQGIAISESSPTSNQVLAYNGSNYTPTDVNASQLQGVGIDSTIPTVNQLLKYNGTNWAPSANPVIEWNPAAVYYTGDIVIRSGSFFRAATTVLGVDPLESANSSYWHFLAGTIASDAPMTPGNGPVGWVKVFISGLGIGFLPVYQ